MTKLTTTQAYNAQVKADRRAAAAERREAGVASDNVRVAALFAKAESPKPAPEVGNIYLLNELDQIQDEEARFNAYQLAALWPVAMPSVPFPGVVYGQDHMNREKVGNWYVNGWELPGDLPAMCRNDGSLTQEVGKAGWVQPGHRGYRFSTVTVRTALGRIKRGKDLFNFGV